MNYLFAGSPGSGDTVFDQLLTIRPAFQTRKKGNVMRNINCSIRRAALAASALGMAALCFSCATKPPVALGIVGPKSVINHAISGQGYLVVYSDTDELRLGKANPYYRHTGYCIVTPDGRPFKWVPNHIGDMDEAPQLVALPSGNYQVIARATDYGQVRVPIVIQPWQTTKVHLEGKGNWQPKNFSASVTNLVRFPDGELIGWQALINK